MASAIIENVQVDGNARIFFIDTGKREFVYRTHLRNLPSSLTNLPAQAVFVKVPNKVKEVRNMQSSSNHYTLVVTSVTQGYAGRAGNVEFCNEGTLIKDSDCPKPIQKKTPAAKQCAIPKLYYVLLPTPLHLREEFRNKTRVFITYFVSPGEFYVRLDIEQENFRAMSEKLQNLMASGKLLPSSDLAEDVVCAVKIDGVWMRCRIISFDEQLAKISLIDVGNIISIKLDQSSRLHGCAAFGESALLAILPNGLAALPIS